MMAMVAAVGGGAIVASPSAAAAVSNTRRFVLGPLAGAGSGKSIAVNLVWPKRRPRALIVCTPGGGASKRYFDLVNGADESRSMARLLAARGFAVAAFDPLGIGESDPPPGDPSLWMPRHAAAAHHALVAALRVGDPRLAKLPVIGLGHSAGGVLVSIQQGAHRSYDAIVLLSSNAGGLEMALAPDEKAFVGKPNELERALPALVKARFGAPFADQPPNEAADRYLGATPLAATARDKMWGAVGITAMVPGSFSTEAGAINVPIFFGYGDHDIGIPPRTAPAGYPSCDDFALVVLKDTFHNLFGGPSIPVLIDRLDDWASAIARRAGRTT